MTSEAPPAEVIDLTPLIEERERGEHPLQDWPLIDPSAPAVRRLLAERDRAGAEISKSAGQGPTVANFLSESATPATAIDHDRPDTDPATE